MKQACCREWGSWMTSVAMYCVHELEWSIIFATHMDSCWDLWVLMHWYTCKCLLNTLGRAVEQLAGCLAKETKVRIEVKVQQSCNAKLVSLSPHECLIRWRKATWIAVNLASPVCFPSRPGARPEKVTCFGMLCQFCVRYQSATWTSPFPSPRTSSQKKSHGKILNGCWEKKEYEHNRKNFPVL